MGLRGTLLLGILCLALSGMGSSALANSKSKKRSPDAQPAVPAAQNDNILKEAPGPMVAEAAMPTDFPPPVSFNLSAGLSGAHLADTGGVGLAVGGALRADTMLPLYFGLDLAVYRFEHQPGYVSLAIQLMPTGYYLFTLPFSRVIHPFMGLSMGTAFFITSVPDAAGVGSTQIVFETLLRPGIQFDFSRKFSLNLEYKVGLLNSLLLYVGQVGLLLNM